jgi:hypothetical protein
MLISLGHYYPTNYRSQILYKEYRLSWLIGYLLASFLKRSLPAFARAKPSPEDRRRKFIVAIRILASQRKDFPGSRLTLGRHRLCISFHGDSLQLRKIEFGYLSALAGPNAGKSLMRVRVPSPSSLFLVPEPGPFLAGIFHAVFAVVHLQRVSCLKWPATMQAVLS